MNRHDTKATTEILKNIGLEEVLESLNLGYSLDFQTIGNQRKGHCPKCGIGSAGTKFQIENDKKFHCFKCSFGGGNAIQLIEKLKGYDFNDARKYLIDTFRPDLKEDFSGANKIEAGGVPTDHYLFEELLKYGKKLLYEEEEERELALSYLLNDRNYKLENLKKTDWFYLPLDKECREYLLQTIPNLSKEGKEYIKGKWIVEEGKNKFVGLSLSGTYGDRFRLAFPYRNANRIITGFVKRALNPKGITVEKKGVIHKDIRYCSATGTNKDDLFNIYKYKKGEELLLVEGYPDALYFDTLNIKTVALGNGVISKIQFEGFKTKEAKSITISLDFDRKNPESKGLKNTLSICKLAIQNKITCFVLPPEKLSPHKDLDEYYRKEGEEALKKLIDTESISGASYLAFHINRELEEEIKQAGGELTDRIKDRARKALLDQLEAFEKEPLLKKDFLQGIGKHFSPELGIDRESLEEYTRRKQEERLALLAAGEAQKGNISKVKELLQDIANLSKTEQELKESFERLLDPYSKEELREAIRNAPPSIESGYTIKGKELLLPAGAITTFCALTSHGKTTFMNNIALNIAMQGKEVHIFNYEESREAILQKVLNAFCFKKGNRESSLEKIKAYYSGKRKVEQMGAKFQEIEEEFFTLKINVHASSYDIDQLIGAISFLSSKREIGAIFIDYFQLLRVSNESKKNSFAGYQQIKEIGDKLNSIAKETKLPIILGAQFNREILKESKLPFVKRMASKYIREAADIEHISNLICGLWAHWMPDNLEKNKAEKLSIKILKNRDGGNLGETAEYVHNGTQRIFLNEGEEIEEQIEGKTFEIIK